MTVEDHKAETLVSALWSRMAALPLPVMLTAVVVLVFFALAGVFGLVSASQATINGRSRSHAI